MLKKWLKLLNKFLSTPVDLFDTEKFEDIVKKKENLKDNLGNFLQEEKREVVELMDGKQNWQKYCQDSSALFKDYFIPHDGNDNKPKILRPKQLTIIAILLLILKVSLVGYLFSVYQQEAEMSDSTINKILILTNESRVASGVSPLNLNSALSKAAQIKAEDMAVGNYFSHTSPDGRKPWDFVNRSDYVYILIGENLAMNFIAASDAHAALMASPSHQKNILNNKYSDIGLAVVSGKIDGEETNILVELFGAKTQAVVQKPDVVQKEMPAPVQPVSITEDVIIANVTNPVQDVVSPVVTKALSENTTTIAVSQPAGESVKETNQANTTTVPETENNVALIEKTAEHLSANNIDSDDLLLPLLGTAATQTSATSTEDINQIISEADSSNAPELINEVSQPLLEEPIYVTSTQNKQINTAAKVMQISKIVYIIFLLFLIVALLINIFIRITVQHKSVIFQAILLIILIVALLLYDFGFMKEIREAASRLIIL